jgi:RTX calcium-binding nonapeptide repeat (4 copies)
MAIAYDTQHQLDHLFASGGLDLSVRNAIIHQLMEDGLFTEPGSRVWVQEGSGGNHSPQAQVLYLDGGHEQVRTDSNLGAIVDTGHGPLQVTGSNDVFVAVGQGVNQVNLSGTTGNDEVMVGGANTNTENDPRGRDNLWTDDHHYSTLAGGGDDRWQNDRGDDRHDQKGNMGWNVDSHQDNWGDEGHYSTLSGGDRDEWNGGHAAGGTTTIVGGSGNDTIVGGNENDLIELGRHGNDVIDGGGGHNTVQFDDSLSNATISSKNGVTTVQFSDTHQTMTLTDIQSLVFTDHHGKG